MTEKDTHPDWIEPADRYQQQGQSYAAPSYPPGQPQMYASRDGAPPGQYAPPPSYYPPPGGPSPQSQYSSQGPPPGYYPPQGDVKYEYDQKNQELARGGSTPSGPSTVYPAYATGPAPDAGPGPSGSQESNKGGFMMTLASFFGPQGPPPMWQRQPPPNLPYNAFPPMCLISNGHDLSKGFPELPPPCQMNPHPFAMHDVAEEDWKRFLGDVKRAASLSPQQRIKSNVIPMVTGVGILGGFFMTNMIEKKMERKNRTAAGDVVDHWNHYFFGPRRMELVLCQASERLSGRFGAAPTGDHNQIRMAKGLRHRTESDDDDSSSSSSSLEDERHSHGHSHGHNQGFMSDRRTRCAARREARHERREARHERREDRRARRGERRARKARGERQLPYELFITVI